MKEIKMLEIIYNQYKELTINMFVDVFICPS